jgi:tRNA uridine 5-carbamoylmethylation protein Kti12
MANNRQPILYLVRGLPGSGKSSFVKYQLHALVNHYEADMYFCMNQEREYRFDQTKLGAAHDWCQECTVESLTFGFDTWVSNTFTTKKELRPYFQIAKETDSALVVMTMHGSFKSIHNVPDEAMQRMSNRFEFDISSLWEEYPELYKGKT